MKNPHPALRVITVSLLSLFFCISYYPDLARVAGHPLGDLGLRTDGSIATTVEPDSPAQRAGIRSGDAIDLSALSLSVRSAIIGGLLPYPGDTATIGVRRAGRFQPVTLRAVPEHGIAAAIVIREIVFTIPLIIGIILVLLRPSAITWGFFLFSLAAGGVPPTATFTERVLTNWRAQVVWDDILVLLGATLPKTGLVLFAFSLARRPFSFWARSAIAATAAIGVLEAIPLLLHPDLSSAGALGVACEIAGAVIALCGLGYAYTQVATRLRQRLHWITAGFILWMIIDITDVLLWPTYEPYWTHTGIDALQMIFPLAVAYAIFRERVIDINFVISRTVAYGLLTTVIVGVFALIDLFLSRTMEARFSLPVDIIVALTLGFFFHGMRRRIDATVDRVIFRKRHVAETRLAKAAKAVVHVDDPAAIADYLTRFRPRSWILPGPRSICATGASSSWNDAPAGSASPMRSFLPLIRWLLSSAPS